MLSPNRTHMIEYFSFIRAINVGGHSVVRMADLKDAFVTAGCERVRTYIQSGNVVFESPDGNPSELFQKIRDFLEHGNRPLELFYQRVTHVSSKVRMYIGNTRLSKKCQELYTYIKTPPDVESERGSWLRRSGVKVRCPSLARA